MLEHGRDATRGGRHGAGREVLAFRVAGVLEVGVHVDRAGHHDEPGGIDQLVRRRTRTGLGQRGDAAVLDHDLRREHRRLGGDRAARDHRPSPAHCHPLTLANRRAFAEGWSALDDRSTDQVVNASIPSPTAAQRIEGKASKLCWPPGRAA